MSILYNLREDNVVVDSLSKLSIGSTSHAKEGRNNCPMKFTDVQIWVSVW